jgi:hypothetical protein
VASVYGTVSGSGYESTVSDGKFGFSHSSDEEHATLILIVIFIGFYGYGY